MNNQWPFTREQEKAGTEMRLFIAIDLPEEAKDRMLRLKRNLKGVNWVGRDQLHLTLLFLGEVGEEKLEQLSRALTGIRFRPFPLKISASGCFPHSHAPRVLWVGFEPQPTLERLAVQVRKTAASCDIPLEDRHFTPHVTLARIKPPVTDEISCFVTQPLCGEFPPFQVSEFVLYQSTLTQQGAVHRALLRVPPLLLTPYELI
jgi:2'-5' RNA ligase